MALTAKKVYAILKRQISDMEAKLNSPVRYRGTVATADLLPLNPDIGDMYNIESKSIYGEAGMNVAWNGVVWDTMGAPIDMSLYFTKEEADAVIQRLVTEYFEKNPVKPGATAEQAQQIEQNKTDIGSLKTETGSLKEDLGNVSNDLTMLRAQACIFVNESDILGVQVDYKNKTFKRLAGAANLSKGSDFDKFTMFGGRKRCNVDDSGSIVAWYGDADYKEDGSMGQVMVYQPKFYYMVAPLEYDAQSTGYGYHLRKANYYVSETQRAGFKLHPAFYDKNGNEVDYILMSAYEGCIYDTSANAYLKNDEQVMDASKDKFSSIAGARPATGV